jgi:hypothetical protein
MVANGDAAKPIWISEMNSNAVPNDPNIAGWGSYGQVTLEQQARYATLAYQRAMEEWPWAGVVNFWFFKRASDAEQNQSWYYFRMVEPDFAPLPVYEAMRAYTANLTPTLYPGTHQEDHWALGYEGDWETARDGAAILGAYRYTTTAGATLRFTFEGTSLTLVPGPGTGEIEYSLDGQPMKRISLDGQPVHLVRNSVFIFPKGRQQRQHEVTLTAVAGEASIDALIVQQPRVPPFWLVLGLLVLALVATWGITRTVRRR